MSATQDDISIHFKLDPNVVARILRGDRTDRLSPELVAGVLDYAQEVGFDFSLLRAVHQRRHMRFNVVLGADAVIQLRSGEIFDQGKITIVNLSLGGARTRVDQMSRRSIPIDPSVIHVKLTQTPLSGLAFDCRPVRLHYPESGGVEVGIEFLPMTPEVQAVIDRYLEGFRRKGHVSG